MVMCMVSRRRFLAGAATGALHACAGLRSARRPERRTILVLGGTSFIGPAIVERALARGHLITLFNRGKTNPALFHGVERIRGDREAGDLAGLGEQRTWDAVIDTWPQDPRLPTATARLLAARTGYYFYVSSVSAYGHYPTAGMDERCLIDTQRSGYGGDKARSEVALTSILPGRVGIARPHAIKGVRDPSLDYLYWLQHFARGGDVLVPDDDSALVQPVDVLDVAEWIVDSVEQRRLGPYNLCTRPVTLRGFLERSRQAIRSQARLVWVTPSFLVAHDVVRTGNVPFWSATRNRSGFDQISADNAVRAGWRSRPLESTAVAAWQSYCERIPPDLMFPQSQWGFEWGLTVERERALLDEWARTRPG
jgi:2'-hydroxyisoflavone reductase